MELGPDKSAESKSASRRESPTSGSLVRYRGRFAPSPTGLLHFGSLVAAVASYLDARRTGGEWLIRIEDLDQPREVAGSADAIVSALDALGFEWTESIVRQSQRTSFYESALQKLLASGDAYYCSCSRTEIQQGTDQGPPAGGEELRYPGWCRGGPLHADRPLAVRIRVPDEPLAFDDAIQARVSVNIAAQTGDFVVRRRDTLFAYQLAVVVDDAAQGITHVVRGADLLHSTPRQILLQQCLGLPPPKYAHVPVATDSNGVKLSKSAGTAALDLTRPGQEVWRALQFLQQEPPQDLRCARPATLWNWAMENWQLNRLRYGLAAQATSA